MKRNFSIAGAVMAIGLTFALMAADPGRERKLQQAIDLMETKGEAAKAVPLLEDVARSADKDLAARGLLYLGQAQERQGGDRARATYQRVVREFGAQMELALEAQRRLAAIGTPPSGLRPRKLNLEITRNYQYDNLSRDGQWFGGTDWATGTELER